MSSCSLTFWMPLNTIYWIVLPFNCGLQIGEMKWSSGDSYGTIYPAPRQPEGTVNFTTADRPTLHIDLANITGNPNDGRRRSEFRVFTEGWDVYDVREGRGRLLFAN